MEGRNLKKEIGRTWVETDSQQHCFVAHDATHPRTPEIFALLDSLGVEAQEGSALRHSEQLALAFALLSTPEGTPILLRNNLRVCRSCHASIAAISKIRNRTIILRDANRVHHFADGKCSCGNYW